MNNATRVSILIFLLVSLGLVAHASDRPWVMAQGGLLERFRLAHRDPWQDGPGATGGLQVALATWS